MGQPRMNPEMPLFEKADQRDVRRGGPDSRQDSSPRTCPCRTRGRRAAREAAEQTPTSRRQRKTTTKADGCQGRRDKARRSEGRRREAGKPRRPRPSRRSTSSWSAISTACTGRFLHCEPAARIPTRSSNFDFDNVPFVLNVLDVLAGDKRFVDIRTRPPVAPHADQDQRRHRKRPQGSRQGSREVLKDFENGESRRKKDFDDQMAELDQATRGQPATGRHR